MHSKGNYHIYDDKHMVQLDKVEALLRDSYWAKDRNIETIEISINNSVCFSLYHHDEQIGFARIVTDHASVAYIADVMIEAHHRGKGLGKWLVEVVVNDSRWKNLLQLLVTDDAHALYEHFGFSSSHKLMSKVQ